MEHKTAEAEIQDYLREKRRTYAEQVPGQLRELEAVSRRVFGDQRSQAAFTTFHFAVHRLVGSGAMYGFNELSSAAQPLDHLLDTIAGDDRPPTVSESLTIHRLLDAVKQAATACTDSADADDAKPGAPLVVPSRADGGGAACRGIENQRSSQHMGPQVDYILPVAPAAETGKTHTILIANDDPIQAEMLRIQLEQAGFRISVAEDGVQALGRACSSAPDIIVSDVLMPRLDGFQLCQAIRQNPRLASLPVLLISAAYTEEADQRLAKQVGANALIGIGTDMQELTDAICLILNTKPAPCAPAPESAVVEAHRARVMWQLERQMRLRLEHEHAEEMLRQINTELEQRVAERTAALQAANERLHHELIERKRAEAAAERASHAKSEFLSRMSHELRTPLNHILGFSQLLALGDLGPDERDSVAQILASGQRLLARINQVLEITDVDAVRRSLLLEPVSVSEVLRDALTGLDPLATEHHVTIDAAAGATCDAYVLADIQRLTTVLQTLVMNAVRFNQHGGTVTVACQETRRGRLRIEVSDMGAGIEPEQLPQLFQPFERLGADCRGIPGTGLGLAAARALVEAMDGSIDVQSSVGQGSVFSVELPVVHGPASAAARDRGKSFG